MLEARDAIVLVLLALLAAASMLAYLWGADPNSLVIAEVERMRAGLGFLRRASLSGTSPLRRSRCSLGKAGNRRLVHQRHEEDSLRPNVFVAAAVRRRQPPTLEMPQPDRRREVHRRTRLC